MGTEIESARTWRKALEAYSYPVDLSAYEGCASFPDFFKKRIGGDRTTTIEFEDYFRKQAPNEIEVWYEVVFWKLYSQPSRRSATAARIMNHTRVKAVTSAQLWAATQTFIQTPSKGGLMGLRALLGLRYGMAVPLTFVAFAAPHSYPLIDRNVADWVNANLGKHDASRNNKLTKFKSRERKKTYFIADSDFDAYLSWVSWCRETATVLSEMTDTCWRARDVEMAIFTAHRNRLSPSVLP